jgi:hypothetical protein
MYYDLDTVVRRPLKNPCSKSSLMLQDFYCPDRSASGLMFIRNEDKQHVWNAWLKNPDITYRGKNNNHGDQGFIADHLPHRQWQLETNNSIMSFKAHIRKGQAPESADVICFHGKPRPWEVNESWVPSLTAGK